MCCSAQEKERGNALDQEAQKGENLEDGDGKQLEGKDDDVKAKDGETARMTHTIKGRRS